MPESETTRISRSTARVFLSRNPQPKYKYIEDPADVVSLTYKNQFSQFNEKYHELRVTVWPIFGRFSGERVVFHYDWDTVKVSVDNNLAYVMFLRAGTSPENLLRFCLNFLYSSDAEGILNKHDANVGDEVCIFQSKARNTPASLVVQCLRSVVINMESLPRNELQYLPSPYQELVQPESFVETKFQLWPRYIRAESTTLMMKKGMIVGEILLLLRQKLQLGRDLEVRLFKSCLSLENDDVIQEENGDYGCVFVQSKMPTHILDAARIGKSRNVIRKAQSNKDVIVASLVGKEMKEVVINLSLPLKFLDIQLRQIFRLKPWSFLALHLPGEDRNIFHTGRAIYTSYGEEFAKFLVSNGKRNFPRADKGIETLGVKEMYKECSVFKKSLRSLGFHPGALVEVFEITGPSIPVMYSGAVTKAQVIDVNPDWPLQTFLYYVKVNTPQAAKIESIDYIKDCNEGTVSDILRMMRNLWNRPNEGGRLEYLRLRS